MVVAWASVLADSFDCGSCRRASSTFACPKIDHVDKDDALRLVAKAGLPGSMPMIFKLESVGICPKAFFTPFAALVAKAYSWWEQGQLGLTLMTAPAWVDDAFNILASGRAKARSYLFEINRGK